MREDDLEYLTARLRALRLPDELAVIISVGNVSEPGCGKNGAVSVTATKGDHTATSKAMRLEDALLMVRARLNEMALAEKKKKEEGK
jgi:hypothetical protein